MKEEYYHVNWVEFDDKDEQSMWDIFNDIHKEQVKEYVPERE